MVLLIVFIVVKRKLAVEDEEPYTEEGYDDQQPSPSNEGEDGAGDYQGEGSGGQ